MLLFFTLIFQKKKKTHTHKERECYIDGCMDRCEDSRTMMETRSEHQKLERWWKEGDIRMKTNRIK